jgi:hypothetical protein
MGWAFSKDEGEERSIQGICGETTENRPLEMSRRRREDNIKMDFQEV